MDILLNKAVIPAAGNGSRLSPVSQYLPKGMLPLGKKPVLHHIVDELREVEIEHIAIVAKSRHTPVFSYFRDFADVNLIIDDSETGPGGALLAAEEFINNDNFVTIFADAPVIGEAREQNLYELIKIKEVKESAAVLSAYKVPRLEANQRGIIEFEGSERLMDGVRRITEIKEKPSKEDLEEKEWASACRYVFGQNIFDALKEIETDGKGELQLSDATQLLIEQGELVVGYPLKDNLKRYDTGTFEGYREAFCEITGD